MESGHSDSVSLFAESQKKEFLWEKVMKETTNIVHMSSNNYDVGFL